MTETLLAFQRVSVFYGAIEALHQVSLEIYRHEIVTLIGANGAGKTSLMMSIYGQPRVRSGEILFENKPIHQLPTHEINHLGITLSPEGRRIFPAMSVEENLMMGNLLQTKKEQQINCDRIYQLFPILQERKKQRAGTLSGGEQQMLAMGRALMSKPKLFLLDEPSLGLAPQLVHQIFNTLKDVAADGATIFLVEQNANMALRIADRAFVLVNGEIQLSGKAKDLLTDPDIQAAYLGGNI